MEEQIVANAGQIVSVLFDVTLLVLTLVIIPLLPVTLKPVVKGLVRRLERANREALKEGARNIARAMLDDDPNTTAAGAAMEMLDYMRTKYPDAVADLKATEGGLIGIARSVFMEEKEKMLQRL